LERTNKGWFKPGQPGAAYKHGLYSDAHLPPGLEWLPAAVEHFRAGQLVDEGQAEADVPARRRAALDNRTTVFKLTAKLTHALDERGMFDKRGKLRVAWLQVLMGLMDRAMRLDALLGLERRQKPVGLEDWIRHAPAEHTAPDQEHSE
jgi:hypothetical protein